MCLRCQIYSLSRDTCWRNMWTAGFRFASALWSCWYPKINNLTHAKATYRNPQRTTKMWFIWVVNFVNLRYQYLQLENHSIEIPLWVNSSIGGLPHPSIGCQYDHLYRPLRLYRPCSILSVTQHALTDWWGLVDPINILIDDCERILVFRKLTQ